MKEILKQLSEARAYIKTNALKKDGRNDFSKYDYFTPEQVDTMVYKACRENGLLTKFDLVRTSLGLNGVLTIYDIASGESIEFEQATDIPVLKATNTTQQFGGAVTYTNRYLLMTAFSIVDNNEDFDSQDQTKKPVELVADKFDGKQISTKPKGNIANALQLIQMAKDSAQLTNVKVKLNDLYWNTEETLEIKKTLTGKVLI